MRGGTPPPLGFSGLGVAVHVHRVSQPNSRRVPAARRSSLPDGGACDYSRKRYCGYLFFWKSGTSYVRFLRAIRWKYPSGGRIYLIQDDHSTHTTLAAVAEVRKLRIKLTRTPAEENQGCSTADSGALAPGNSVPMGPGSMTSTRTWTGIFARSKRTPTGHVLNVTLSAVSISSVGASLVT
jgi:hypothetical protein